MDNKAFFIVPKDRQRSAMWDRLFGVARLPIIHNRARWQPINGRETYSYDLHLGKLSQVQRDRFAAYVARRTQRRYVDVKIEFDTALAYPIVAQGCTVEIEETNEAAAHTRPFFFCELLRIVKKVGGRTRFVTVGIC